MNKIKNLKWWLIAIAGIAFLAIPTQVSIPFMLDHVFCIQNIFYCMFALIIYCWLKVREEKRFKADNDKSEAEFNYRQYGNDDIADSFKNRVKSGKK